MLLRGELISFQHTDGRGTTAAPGYESDHHPQLSFLLCFSAGMNPLTDDILGKG